MAEAGARHRIEPAATIDLRRAADGVRNRARRGGVLPLSTTELLTRRAARPPWEVVAVVDGEVVGCAHLDDPYEEPGGMQLVAADLTVDPGHRSEGIGAALLAALLDNLPPGPTRVPMWSDPTDLAAARLAALAGFERDEPERFRQVVRLEAVPHAPGGPLVVRALDERFDRWAELHAAWAEGVADVPGPEPEVEDLEEWLAVHADLASEGALRLWAELDGAIVGGCTIERCAGTDVGFIDLTYLARRSRGRGLALVLKQAAHQHAAAAGFGSLATHVAAANAPMQRVNDRLGYLAADRVWAERRS